MKRSTVFGIQLLCTSVTGTLFGVLVSDYVLRVASAPTLVAISVLAFVIQVTVSAVDRGRS